jgi:hypothetical protein
LKYLLLVDQVLLPPQFFFNEDIIRYLNTNSKQIKVFKLFIKEFEQLKKIRKIMCLQLGEDYTLIDIKELNNGDNIINE